MCKEPLMWSKIVRIHRKTHRVEWFTCFCTAVRNAFFNPGLKELTYWI